MGVVGVAAKLPTISRRRLALASRASDERSIVPGATGHRFGILARPERRRMEGMPNSVRDTLMRRTSGVGKWCGGRSQQHTSTGAAPTNGSQTSTPPLAGPAPSRSAPEPLAAASAAAPEGLMHGQEEDPDGFTYMPLNLAYPGLKLVHKRPPIYVCEDFLSDEECRQLIKVGTPLLPVSYTHLTLPTKA